MHKPFLVMASFLLAVTVANAQGVFGYYNGGVPTHLGSIEGPLADTNIFARMLAGAQPDSLTPVGSLDFHITGIVSGPPIAVPGIPPNTFAYVQMVAWDSFLWGTDLASVPADQLGRTDIVPVFLTTGVFPDGAFVPSFTQPAIVPIPEPSAWALLALGTAALWCARRSRR